MSVLNNGDDAELSLEDSLSAAFDEHDEPDLGQPLKERAPKETPRVVAPRETSQEAAERVRDEHGRFAAKEAKEAASADNNSNVDDETGRETAAAATHKPPASWAPEHHETWAALSPAIQEYILKRETEASGEIQKKSEALKAYEKQIEQRTELDRVLAPHREKWALNGLSDHSQVQRLLAAQDLLNKDPAAGLRWLAESFKLNPAQIFTAAQDQSNTPPAQIHPLIAQQLEQLRQAHAEVAKKQSEWEAAREAEKAQMAIQSDIEKFKADPAHKFHDVPSVKARMVSLLDKGAAETLKEAYEIAIYADPDVRQKVLDEQTAARNGANGNAAEAQTKAKAEAARKARGAAISVKGAPSGVNAKALASTIEEQLAANWVDN